MFFLSRLFKVQEVQSALRQMLAHPPKRGQLQLALPQVWKPFEADVSSAETRRLEKRTRGEGFSVRVFTAVRII